MAVHSYLEGQPEFFVEWQMPDQPGAYIDLSADREVVLSDEAQIRNSADRGVGYRFEP